MQDLLKQLRPLYKTDYMYSSNFCRSPLSFYKPPASFLLLILPLLLQYHFFFSITLISRCIPTNLDPEKQETPAETQTSNPLQAAPFR